MKIFKTNIGVLPKESKKNLDVVLQQMRAGRKYSQTDYHFSDSRIVRCEIPTKNATIFDDLFSKAKETKIRIKKRTYFIDNKKGTVSAETNLIDKIFISSKKSIKNINDILDLTKNNFDNLEIVKQCRIVFEGLTKKGYELIQKAMNK